MEPMTPEQEQAARFAACGILREHGFRPLGGWLFMKGDTAYDLSADDLTQIDRIVSEGLFVVEITDLPQQAQATRDAVIAGV
jgi:hypothetical protein